MLPLAKACEFVSRPISSPALRALLVAGSMGQVRFVQRGAIEQQLSAGNLVLLTNIGVSSSGELLNCNCFDVSPAHAPAHLPACLPSMHACMHHAQASAVRPLPPWADQWLRLLLPPTCARLFQSSTQPCPAAGAASQVATHAAVELRADKLLLLTGEDVRGLELPHYLPLVGRRARPSHRPGCQCLTERPLTDGIGLHRSNAGAACGPPAAAICRVQCRLGHHRGSAGRC